MSITHALMAATLTLLSITLAYQDFKERKVNVTILAAFLALLLIAPYNGGVLTKLTGGYAINPASVEIANNATKLLFWVNTALKTLLLVFIVTAAQVKKIAWADVAVIALLILKFPILHAMVILLVASVLGILWAVVTRNRHVPFLGILAVVVVIGVT